MRIEIHYLRNHSISTFKCRGREWVSEISDKPLRKLGGRGCQDLPVTKKYIISTIIGPKFQYIFCLFPQNSVQISYCNRSCKFMHLFWTPGLPDEVHSNRPCYSVRWSVFRYLWDCSLVFSKTLYKVAGH